MDENGSHSRALKKLHLRYIRLPNHVSNLHDDLVYRTNSIIIGRGKIASAHPIIFDGKTVLADGFKITYFDLVRK